MQANLAGQPCLVLTNGEVPHRRLHDAALRPGTELCAMQAQFQQDDRVFAERARVASEREDNEQREEEQVANEADLLGHSGALRRLTELLSHAGVSVSMKLRLEALVTADGLVHPAKRTLLDTRQ